jgi:hypothetical protein
MGPAITLRDLDPGRSHGAKERCPSQPRREHLTSQKRVKRARSIAAGAVPALRRGIRKDAPERTQWKNRSSVQTESLTNVLRVQTDDPTGCHDSLLDYAMQSSPKMVSQQN